MSEFGKKLKKERTARKISIEDFSYATKISAKYLRAIESGTFEHSLAPVYLLGIVRAYAEHFGLKEEMLFTEYLEEVKKTDSMNDTGAFAKAPVGAGENPEPKKQMINPKILSYSFTLALALFILGYLFYQFNFLGSDPQVTILEPDASLITSKETIDLRGTVSPADSSVTVNNQLIPANEKGEFEKEISLIGGSNIFEIKATNKYGKTTVVVRKIFKE